MPITHKPSQLMRGNVAGCSAGEPANASRWTPTVRFFMGGLMLACISVWVSMHQSRASQKATEALLTSFACRHAHLAVPQQIEMSTADSKLKQPRVRLPPLARHRPPSRPSPWYPQCFSLSPSYLCCSELYDAQALANARASSQMS